MCWCPLWSETIDPFEASVLAFLTECGKIEAGDTAIIAISGGADSVALLHAVNAVKVHLGLSIHAAHMEHGIRGEESRADASFTDELCASLDIPIAIESADIPAIAVKSKRSVQTAARVTRHSFLREEAARHCKPGRERILIAHNLEDRAETILMNAARGTGLDGLCAMPAVRLPYLRPIVGKSRSEVLAYLGRVGQAFRTDRSNADKHYARNKVRLDVMPALADAVNGDVAGALCRLAELCEPEAALLNELANNHLKACTVSRNAAALWISRPNFVSAHIALQRRALRLAVLGIRGSLSDIGLDETSRIVDMAALRGTHTVITLPMSDRGTHQIYLTETQIGVLETPSKILRLVPTEEAEIVANTAKVPYGSLEIEIQRLNPSDLLATQAALKSAGFETYLLLLETTDRLYLRAWRPGDRMRPSGMLGTKKLQDVYTDYKVRSADRWKYPVLERRSGVELAEAEILAIIGLRNSASVIPASQVATEAEQFPARELTIVGVRPLSI